LRWLGGHGDPGLQSTDRPYRPGPSYRPGFARGRANQVNFEVWLPLPSGWNGKFEGVGNGGLAGTISYNSMAPGLQRGFATASRYWAQFD
jgi:hypothetical protein